jgi:hypothetical protein
VTRGLCACARIARSSAGRAAGERFLRTALRGITAGIADKRMYARMAGVMLAVARLDKVHGRGGRTVADGDAGVLEGFEFNKRASFADVVRADYQVVADRVAGTVTARVPVLHGAIVMPAGATHARLVAGVAAVDFRTETHDAGHRYSDYINLRGDAEHVVELVQDLPSRGGPVVVVLGIEFFQQVNGAMCRLADKTRNAMVIAGVVSANGRVKRDEVGEAYSAVWFRAVLDKGVFPLGRFPADGYCLARGPDVTVRGFPRGAIIWPFSPGRRCSSRPVSSKDFFCGLLLSVRL